MAHTSLSILKKALLAAGALTLIAVTAPTAYAAPGDHKASKHRHSSAKADHRTNKRVDRRSDRREHTRNHRSDRRDYSRNRGHNYRGNRHNTRRDNYRPRRDNYRPAPHYKRQAKHYNRGHHTPYRSKIGISFNFGTPGYSRHRWAPAAHSFYRPSYGNYRSYQTRTTCHRVVLEGWRHGYRELVSVKQCSNPWDGTYIIQGSERLVDRRW